MNTYYIERIGSGLSTCTNVVEARSPEHAIQARFPKARIMKNRFPRTDYFDVYGAQPTHICRPKGSVNIFEVVFFYNYR